MKWLKAFHSPLVVVSAAVAALHKLGQSESLEETLVGITPSERCYRTCAQWRRAIPSKWSALLLLLLERLEASVY